MKSNMIKQSVINLINQQERVLLPIVEVSRSNTTSVDFWKSDELRGEDVGGSNGVGIEVKSA